MSGGEFLYQDYLFDDAGANDYTASQGNGNTWYYHGITDSVGDYMYPDEMRDCRNNCADLLEFRAARDGGNVHFLIRLTTLLKPDTTVAAIAIGPYGEDGPAHEWPLGATLSTPGTEHVITVWGTGGKFDDKPLEDVGGKVAVNTKANAIEVSLPVGLVGSRFRAYVGTGLWDAEAAQWQVIHQSRTYTEPGLRLAYDGNDYTTPAVSAPRSDLPRVFNVAFRPGEIGNWFEDAQGAALGAKDISAFHADIDLGGADRAAKPFRPGAWVQRIFESSITIPPGEGVYANFPGVQGRGLYTFALCCPVPTRFHFVGKYQPYALYVPKGGYDRAILANHPGTTSYGAMTKQPTYADLAEAADAVMVTPHARGVISFCTDYAHHDVLEAWDDAMSLFPHGARAGKPTRGSFIDTDRNMLWGYSMGGLCSGRLAVLHPDEFASAVQWAASTALNEDHEPADTAAGHPANGNEMDLMQNTRGIYWRINHCIPDEVAYYPGAALHAQRLEELGYIYNFRSLAAGSHLTCGRGGYEADAKATERAVIDHNPAQVTYTTEQGWWRPDISKRLVFDHAYWVSGLRTRERSEPGENRTAYGTVDAVTYGLAGQREFATEKYGPRSGVNGDGGFPYEEHGRRPVKGKRFEHRNALETTLTNLRNATFDLDRMGLTTHNPLKVEASTDGAATITLTDAAGASPVDCKPTPCPRVRSKGDRLVVSLAKNGDYRFTLVRGGPALGSGSGGDDAGSPETHSRVPPDDRSASAQVASSRGSTLALTGASVLAFLFLALGLAATGALLRRLAREPSTLER
ncbi:MAG TPA: hypothetical protein VG929_04570 [Actinomycetota bacterium]|nr:hypothetical protein [Actinomycetota bacterium]